VDYGIWERRALDGPQEVLVNIPRNQVLIAVALVLLSAGATGWFMTVHGQGVARAAIAKAQASDALAVAKDSEARQANTESERLKTQASAREVIAHQQDATISGLKGTIAKLKAQRPAGTPETPIENAQDGLIESLGTKITALEGALSDTQASLAQEAEAYKRSQEAYTQERSRAEDLAKALSKIPKPMPWHIGFIRGKTDTRVTQYAWHGSRDFGPVSAGAVVMPHFVGVEIGINF
jgi:hypothetical protein